MLRQAQHERAHSFCRSRVNYTSLADKYTAKTLAVILGYLLGVLAGLEEPRNQSQVEAFTGIPLYQLERSLKEIYGSGA